MNSWRDSVAFWATILGTLVGLFGVVQSLAWIALLGVVVTAGSIGAVFYAHTERLRVQSADLVINGRGIDSLGMANLRRRLNRTLAIQEVRNEAVIDREDLTVTWQCTGYCRADSETAIEFSIDADTNVPFDELECSAYDLRHDPRQHHRISPLLVGPDGLSKKIAVPFLEPLDANDPFAVLLTYRLPGCMRAGADYYTAALSFAQTQVPRFTTRLIFPHDRPDWLRVYQCGPGGVIRLLKDLRPVREESDMSEYQDAGADVSGASARIYMFSRRRATAQPPDVGHARVTRDSVTNARRAPPSSAVRGELPAA